MVITEAEFQITQISDIKINLMIEILISFNVLKYIFGRSKDFKAILMKLSATLYTFEVVQITL